MPSGVRIGCSADSEPARPVLRAGGHRGGWLRGRDASECGGATPPDDRRPAGRRIPAGRCARSGRERPGTGVRCAGTSFVHLPGGRRHRALPDRRVGGRMVGHFDQGVPGDRLGEPGVRRWSSGEGPCGSTTRLPTRSRWTTAPPGAYPYTDFPLLEARHGRPTRVRTTSVRYAHGVVVHGWHVAFFGGPAPTSRSNPARKGPCSTSPVSDRARAARTPGSCRPSSSPGTARPSPCRSGSGHGSGTSTRPPRRPPPRRPGSRRSPRGPRSCCR